jgi:hypothetical protein
MQYEVLLTAATNVGVAIFTEINGVQHSRAKV